MSNKLKKKLNPVNVWAIAFGCIIGWGAFVNPSKRFLPNSGTVGTAIAFVLGAIVMIIFSFSYAYMVHECPEAGGEFSYAKKYLSKIVAFICGWFLIAAYLSNVPMNSTAIGLIFEGLFGNVLKFGPHYSVAGFEIWFGEIIVSVSILTLFTILNIFGVKKTAIVQTILASLLVISIFSLFIASFFSKDIDISNLNPIWGFKYIEGKIIPNTNIASSIFATFAIAPWAFVGFDTIPQAAEEVKFSYKKVIFVMIIAILFGMFVYISNNTLTAIVFRNWPEECASGKWVLLIAAEKILGKFGKVLVGTAVFSAVLSGIMGFYYASSRLMYSMSKSNYLPKTFCKINKHGCPSKALLFCFIISLTGPFLGREALGWFVDMSSIGASVGFLIASICCFLITKKRKSNKLINLTALLGMIFSSFFIILQLIPIKGLDGVSFGWQSYVLFGFWLFVGLTFMIVKRKDIGLLSISTMKKIIKTKLSKKENVIIMAAGLGSRMLPVTLKTPKPLIEINGVPMIETIIDAILEKRNINHIYVIVGYKKEQFKYLIKKYKNLSLITNNKYETVNNIFSIFAASKVLEDGKNCFICEGDLVVSDNNIFNAKLSQSCYFGKYVKGRSDDWVFDVNNDGLITRIHKGGTSKFNMCGISYFLSNDAKSLSKSIKNELVTNNKYKSMFWDEVVDKNLGIIKMKICPIKINQITELDTVEELNNYKKILSDSFKNVLYNTK